jgi:hypothetical protein
MADQTGALVVRDGTTPSSVRQLGCTIDGSGVYYPVHNLRADGVIVGVAAPLPVIVNPLLSVTTVTSTALESSRLLKAGAGRVLSVHLNATDSGWFMLLDAIAAPADGPITPKKAWQFQASAPATIDVRFDPPLIVNNGAVLVFSSTGPFTKTSLAAAMFSGEVITLGQAPDNSVSSVDQVATNLANEISARTSADSAETAARISADNNLSASIPSTPSAVMSLFSAAISSLPTSLPGTSGVLWNNGGLLSVS